MSVVGIYYRRMNAFGICVNFPLFIGLSLLDGIDNRKLISISFLSAIGVLCILEIIGQATTLAPQLKGKPIKLQAGAVLYSSGKFRVHRLCASFEQSGTLLPTYRSQFLLVRGRGFFDYFRMKPRPLYLVNGKFLLTHDTNGLDDNLLDGPFYRPFAGRASTAPRLFFTEDLLIILILPHLHPGDYVIWYITSSNLYDDRWKELFYADVKLQVVRGPRSVPVDPSSGHIRQNEDESLSQCLARVCANPSFDDLSYISGN